MKTKVRYRFQQKGNPDMKVKILCVISLLGVLLAVSGCSKPEINEVSPWEEFTLSPGESADIAGEYVTVKFIEVISDSRCPQGATCIWEGEASSLVKITAYDVTYEKILTQSGASTLAFEDFQDYQISFNLLPYPVLGTDIEKGDYRLNITIGRISAPT